MVERHLYQFVRKRTRHEQHPAVVVVGEDLSPGHGSLGTHDRHVADGTAALAHPSRYRLGQWHFP